MTTRSRLSSCFVLLIVGVMLVIGCATSGDGSTEPTGCTDPQVSCNGACVDPTSDNANCGACGNACPTGQACTNSMCGACVPPQTQCGTTCVVVGTDNKNCGKCGASCGTNQVCSNGSCSTHCMTGLTTCGGGGSDAGSDAAHDATTSDATNDATPDAPADAQPDVVTTDAASDAAREASSSDAASDAASEGGSSGSDAGGGPLYCADTQTDPMNCGGCGVACSPGHACKMGTCQLDCPAGKHACNASNLCITDGTCCTSADCTVGGETCSGPGDMCKCPTGKKICAANNACIDSATCCTDTDCAGVAGSTCAGRTMTAGGTCSCSNSTEKACAGAGACIPNTACCTTGDCSAVMGETCNGVAMNMGGTCACPTGQKVCPTTASCIPTASCCSSADCALTSNVATTACGGTGACSVATCTANHYDINATYSDGCECLDAGMPKTCGGAGNSVVGIGANVPKTGNLPAVGEENWYEFTFPNVPTPTSSPKITFTTNPGNAFVFDVYSTCGGAALACPVESNVATGKTIWEFTTAGNAGDPPNSNGHSGEVHDGKPNYTAGSTGLVGNNGIIYVRVRRASGNPTCDSYILTATD